MGAGITGIDALPAGRPIHVRGAHIRLRDVRPDDAEGAYVDWMNDPEVVRYTESRQGNCTPNRLRAYIESVRADNRSVLCAIELLTDGRHIGNIKLGPVDQIHRSAAIGIILGEKDCWGRGYASETIALISDYAFDRLALNKLNAGIYAPNIGCLRAFEKAGFQQEGLLRHQCLFEGNYVDVLQVGRKRADGPWV